MNKQTKILGSLLLSSSLLLAAACGDDTSNNGGGNEGGDNNTGAGNTGAGTDGGGGSGNGGEGGSGGDFVIPPKPGLGAQIDRMGRPAINTALKGAFVGFDMDGNVTRIDNAARAALEDTYNESADPAMWGMQNTNIFALNLAVIDSLDAHLNGTSNEAACENLPTCADSSMSTCYGTFATALSRDVLFVRSDGTDCSAADTGDPFTGYLAVEFQGLGIPNAGCGGRRPIDDVIEITYSTLALGNPAAGFDDAITPPADTHPELFPYLAEPL